LYKTSILYGKRRTKHLIKGRFCFPKTRVNARERPDGKRIPQRRGLQSFHDDRFLVT
jgi:hypothetical protein